MSTINVARDFSRYPAGRFRSDGSASGERFREEFLVPRLARREHVLLEMDGTLGYGSSFLEEAFGGLIRVHHLSAGDVLSLLELRSRDAALIREIQKFVRDASTQGVSAFRSA